MSQFPQNCKYIGHEQNKVKYVCLEDSCQQNRLFCFQCLKSNHHQHKNNQENIFDKDGLINLVGTMIQRIKHKQEQKALYFKEVAHKIRIIIKQIQVLLDSIDTVVQEIEMDPIIQADLTKLNDNLNKIKSTKLALIDDIFLNEIRNLERFQFNQSLKEKTREKCDQITININNIQQLSQQFTQGEEMEYQKLKNIKFDIKLLQQLTDKQIYSATISSDLKFIVSGGTDQILKVWNYSDYILIKEYKLDKWIYRIKFTDDCKLLFVCLSYGLLYCYDVQNSFQQISKLKIHQDHILNIHCITNTIVLTSSFEQTIIKTDISLNQQLFLINAHDDRIDGLDYHKSRDVIASCSCDKSMKLWDNKGLLLIQQQNAHNSGLYQILFIINNDQLISLDNIKVAIIWKINYQNKELVKINSITDNNSINNISLVLNQSFILIICDDYIKFYTIKGQYVSSIEQNINEFLTCSDTQLDSIKSIIVKGQRQLKICRLDI